MSKSKIRQVDIAREAGVGVATVDRVLNGRPMVRESTVKRVMDAVRRLEASADTPDTPPIPPNGFQFDFILPAGTNTFMSILEQAILHVSQDAALQRTSIRCLRVESFDPDRLADAIRGCIGRSDGLAIVALEHPTVREAVNEAIDQGLPVVTLVSNLTGARKLAYVGLNNRMAGRTAGYLMGRFLGNRPAKVALLEGSLTLSYRDHQERELGFRDALAEQFPQIEIVDSRPTFDRFDEARRATTDLLEIYPDLAGLYSIGAGVRGIVGALQDSGRASEVVMIAHDLHRMTRALLLDGTIDAIIDQNPAQQAREAARLLREYKISGRILDPDPPKVEIFVRENLP